MTAASDTIFRLSKLEFDVVWEHLELGSFPTVYRMLGHGQTDEERAGLVRQAWESLEAKRLGGPVSLDPRLADMLSVLAQPAREVDARIGHRGKEVRALAGSRGELAAIGVLDSDGFRFSEITPGGLPKAVVGLLPEHKAGHGASVSLPSAAFSAACETSRNTVVGLRTALTEHGVRVDDVVQLSEAMEGVFGGGQFGAAIRDRWGKRHRASRVVGLIDSDAGRYLLESRTAMGGEPWTTIAPTDPARLAAQVNRLLDELGSQLAAV